MKGLIKQRTFKVHDEKITIKSRFKGFSIGFNVFINGRKFFNTGENGSRLKDFKNADEWRENMRETAEDRCFKRWLDIKFS